MSNNMDNETDDLDLKYLLTEWHLIHLYKHFIGKTPPKSLYYFFFFITFLINVIGMNV